MSKERISFTSLKYFQVAGKHFEHRLCLDDDVADIVDADTGEILMQFGSSGQITLGTVRYYEASITMKEDYWVLMKDGYHGTEITCTRNKDIYECEREAFKYFAFLAGMRAMAQDLHDILGF